MSAFIGRHRNDLDQILSAVQCIGGFTAEIMAIFDTLGWSEEHEITSASLLMWSGGIDAYSADLERPSTMRRMLRTGADLQLTQFMHALVGIATERASSVESASQAIITATSAAAQLAGHRNENTLLMIFRMWRVRFLPGLLTPSAVAPAANKEKLREYAHTLERMIDKE
ncbi:hypothetical protein [Streptomyces sp. NBC_01408]|uniref:hypothetical protein n=1 Tax=Streptomyces sp. NBC_01408 TaxID=2903855 RepID=UPI0022542582|nr:hypothetical protein [Streptomyces sp. NBC_01408]MCX4692679.1 hypothetical protein [Streptomyces sp. NBC_01408]